MADLMRETEDVASKRRAFKEMHALLRQALDIVNEVRKRLGRGGGVWRCE